MYSVRPNLKDKSRVAGPDESKVEDIQQRINNNSGHGRDPPAVWRELYGTVDFEQLARVFLRTDNLIDEDGDDGNDYQPLPVTNEGRDPPSIWRELYGTVDFEQLAQGFLRTHNVTDEDDDGNNYQRLPVTDEDIVPNWNRLQSEADFEAIAAALLKAFISEPLQEPHFGEDQATSGQNNIPESTYNLNDITNKDSFKVGQWKARTDIYEISDYDVMFFPNNMSIDEMIQKSELFEDADGWLEISAAQPVENVASQDATNAGANASPKLTGTITRANSSKLTQKAAGVEEISKLQEARQAETSKLPEHTMSILIRKREDIKLELVLCMQYYQMVWMNIGEVCFVLINCDSRISEHNELNPAQRHQHGTQQCEHDQHQEQIKQLLMEMKENWKDYQITDFTEMFQNLPNSPQASASKKMYEEIKISHVLEQLLKTLVQKDINVVISATQTSALEKIFRGKQGLVRTDISTREFAFCGQAQRQETPSSEPYFHFKIRGQEGNYIKQAHKHTEGCAEESQSSMLKVVTWNIDGSTEGWLLPRVEKIYEKVETMDIILLQEFPAKLLNQFYKENRLPQHTKLFGWRKLGPCQFMYNATMIRAANHNTGTSLTSIRVQDYFLECKTKMKGTDWLLLNCHLLSNRSKAREIPPQVQREQSFQLMKERAATCQYVLIGGDTNQLESETSDKSLRDTLIEVWANQKQNIREEYKYTWDPDSKTLYARIAEFNNKHYVNYRNKQARFDRFYFKSASHKVHSYEHIGMKEVHLTVSTQHLSDHWGVCIKIKVSP